MKNILKYPTGILMLMFIFVSETLFGNPTLKDTQETTQNSVLCIFIFLIGLLIGAISIYLYSRWKIYTILSTEKHFYFESLKNSEQKYFFKYIGLIGELKKRKDVKKSDNIELMSENEELKKELKKSKIVFEKVGYISQNRKDSRENNEADIISVPIDLSIEPVKSFESEMYFEIPEEDGTFKIHDGKRKQNTYSFYKIIAGKDPLQGEIHFIPGSLDLRALGNIDNYLNPVCEIDNISDRMHAKKIKMLNPGTVFLNGESWKIDVNNKVKIRLI
jgi:hypothetical protein